jgi:6-phosphogluconolactonase (cycloisomerase 2 family)
MRNMRIYTVLVGLTLLLAACTSYEDAFNRNLDSTGLYITNSSSNTVSQFAADPKSGILNDLGTVAAGTTPGLRRRQRSGHVRVRRQQRQQRRVRLFDQQEDAQTRVRKFGGNGHAAAYDRPAFGGKFAYVVNETNGYGISGYSVDSTTGGLTALGAAEPTGAGTSRSMTIVTGFNKLFDYRGCRRSVASASLRSIAQLALVAAQLRHYLRMQRCPDACGNQFRHNAPYVYAACSNGQAGEYFPVNNWPGTNACNRHRLSRRAPPSAAMARPQTASAALCFQSGLEQ